MSKIKEYKILTTMPSIFNWYQLDWGHYDVDMFNNPDGENEKHLLSGLWGFYGKSRFGEKDRYIVLPKVKNLIDSYGYKVTHDYQWTIDEEFVSLTFTLFTDALGIHLETIMDSVYSEYRNIGEGYSEWIREAKIKCHGWQNVNPEIFLPVCEHKKKTRLQIMNDKDGSIVEVLECNKCKELSKRTL